MPTPALNFANFDQAVRPQDDLYAHVNGAWLKTASIPADRSSTGSFDKLREDSEAVIHQICQELAERDDLDPASDEARIAALYRSFLDEAAAQTKGAAPLSPLLDRIDAIASLDDLWAWMAFCQEHGFSTLFDMGVEADPGDPKRYLLAIAQGGLGLPDESYYHQPEHQGIRDLYRPFLAKALALGAGREQASAADQADAKAIWDLEVAIAKCHWDIVATRDMVAIYNLMTRTQLADDAPGFGWETIWASAGFGDQIAEVNNNQPSFFREIAALLTPEALPSWKAWARAHLIIDLSPYLSNDFVNHNFDFYSKALTGTQEIRPRWKRAVAFTEGAMGDALGRLYIKDHYPAEAARRMAELVDNLLAAYRQSITDLTWMGEATKQEALKKLDGFRPKIGHPQHWRDFSGLTADPDDLVGNLLVEGRFKTAYQIGKLNGPVDPDEWFMYPHTVNAYYHPLRNEIVFPAAILQPPFFNVNADDAVNYGGIGAVIGHEIGHGFDDQGSTCDGEGRLRDWWTAEDRAAFEKATKALIAQYDALSPAQTPGQHVNGALTIGENIGDLGGLSIAIKAWRLAAGDDVAPIDGLSGLQRLFFSWASVWQQASRPERTAQLLAIDPHSPNPFRCNQTIRNIDDFFAAFDVQPGDGQWLDPQERVTIW
ncbi:MAG: peptidase M13 [Propionibacteriaceae bacterium]|jgi:putative endopeptidase|nr:peptidase M13 [Propionibacteriaceae bacterium]